MHTLFVIIELDNNKSKHVPSYWFNRVTKTKKMDPKINRSVRYERLFCESFSNNMKWPTSLKISLKTS